GSLGADDIVRIVREAVRDLSLGHRRAGPVRPLVEDIDMVEDIALIVGVDSASGTDAADRRDIFHRPEDLVDAMAGLFDQAVAAEPYKVIPVADLPLDIAHPRRAR